jgi:uncharacterized protein YbcI
MLCGRPLLEALVREVTGTPPVSVHHDISTATGEEVIVFISGVDQEGIAAG